MGRLRDAIVLGYQLHRSATMPGGRLDLEVPEWYSSWASEATPAPSPGGASPLPLLEPLLDTQPRALRDDPAHRSAHPPATGSTHELRLSCEGQSRFFAEVGSGEPGFRLIVWWRFYHCRPKL